MENLIRLTMVWSTTRAAGIVCEKVIWTGDIPVWLNMEMTGSMWKKES